ncbi:MAG: DUF4265 domain-containing protein [Bacteroidetes bacterium]|nr:DUF4265 domain-containing protein [Bacteroidota bacterium]
MKGLNFLLKVQDGWPPVSSECLSSELADGGYRVTSAPLFIKGISNGDIIRPTIDNDGFIRKWEYLFRSGRTTIWLGRLNANNDIKKVLSELRTLGCNTVSLDALGSHSIDVPEDLPIEKVDTCLEKLNPKTVAIAYPSFRHIEFG